MTSETSTSATETPDAAYRPLGVPIGGIISFFATDEDWNADGSPIIPQGFVMCDGKQIPDENWVHKKFRKQTSPALVGNLIRGATKKSDFNKRIGNDLVQQKDGEDFKPVFSGNMPELPVDGHTVGIEGQIPPHMTGIGDWKNPYTLSKGQFGLSGLGERRLTTEPSNLHFVENSVGQHVHRIDPSVCKTQTTKVTLEGKTIVLHNKTPAVHLFWIMNVSR